MTEVKCLNKDQMLFILHNREKNTAQQMADHLRVEKHKVTLFCQCNNITPLEDEKVRRAKNMKVNYHIPFLPFNYKINWRNK